MIEAYLNVDKELIENSKDVVDEFKAVFPLTKTELNTGEQQITQNVSGVTGNKYLKMNVYHGDEFDSCTSYARVYSIIGKYK